MVLGVPPGWLMATRVLSREMGVTVWQFPLRYWTLDVREVWRPRIELCRYRNIHCRLSNYRCRDEHGAKTRVTIALCKASFSPAHSPSSDPLPPSLPPLLFLPVPSPLPHLPPLPFLPSFPLRGVATAGTGWTKSLLLFLVTALNRLRGTVGHAFRFSSPGASHLCLSRVSLPCGVDGEVQGWIKMHLCEVDTDECRLL